MDVKHVYGYAESGLTVKAPEGVKVDQVFVCSSEVVDRTREIIRQDGWKLGEFKNNPIFLPCHLHRLQNGEPPCIGSWPALEIQKQVKTARGPLDVAMVGGAAFDTEYPLAVNYRGLYQRGHMKAVSVGFNPIKGEYQIIEGERVYVHLEQELIEISAVAVGANQEALTQLRTLGYDPKDLGAKVDNLAEAMKTLQAEVKSATLSHTEIEDLKAWIMEQMDQVKSLLPDLGGAASRHAGCDDDDGADPASQGDAGKSEGSAAEQAAARLLGACKFS